MANLPAETVIERMRRAQNGGRPTECMALGAGIREIERLEALLATRNHNNALLADERDALRAQVKDLITSARHLDDCECAVCARAFASTRPREP